MIKEQQTMISFSLLCYQGVSVRELLNFLEYFWLLFLSEGFSKSRNKCHGKLSKYIVHTEFSRYLGT